MVQRKVKHRTAWNRTASLLGLSPGLKAGGCRAGSYERMFTAAHAGAKWQRPSQCMSADGDGSFKCAICPCVCVFSESCPTLCDPVDCSPTGSPVHGVFQAVLEWGTVSAFWQGETPVSLSPALAGGLFATSATWEALQTAPRSAYLFTRLLPSETFPVWGGPYWRAWTCFFSLLGLLALLTKLPH